MLVLYLHASGLASVVLVLYLHANCLASVVLVLHLYASGLAGVVLVLYLYASGLAHLACPAGFCPLKDAVGLLKNTESCENNTLRRALSL